jgi:C1A family cysteine protease
MNRSFLLGALAIGARSREVWAEFKDFMQKYDMQFTEQELGSRYQTFKANLELIEAHNTKNASWTMAINQFSAMTAEEFQSVVGGRYQLDAAGNEHDYVNTVDSSFYAPALDWRAKGVVTAVGNEDKCKGGCWAFAANDAMESACAIVTNHSVVPFSRQQILDCTGNGNDCSRGGRMTSAFSYAQQQGICTAKSYPYADSSASGYCRAQTCEKVDWCRVTGSRTLVGEEAILNTIQQQPVTVAVAAVHVPGWQHYSQGVFSDYCDTHVDHGVLVVGYGSDQGLDYWVLKNDWGPSWGENGYMRMVKGRNECGVGTVVAFPSVQGAN